MSSHADSTVTIQTSAESVLSPPSWFREVVLLAEYLRKHGLLTKISERIRFARRRFGHYAMIDFLAVQIAVCYQRGTHLGSILPETATFCGPLHGLVWP